MTREDRLNYIKELEELRDSKIIIYISGDRRGLETKIAYDVIPIIQNILINSHISKKKIELLLYSIGGDGPTALTLVTLIREYCDEFNVIVPWKALSAATLIALGANSIIMLKTGQLSPVDVSITTAYNPSIETPTGQQHLPINVEDLSGYINFSKNILGIEKEENLIEVLKYLTEKVHPLALGAVHRAREKNSKIASTLLQYHMKDETRIKKISDIITMGLYEHSFLINKRDAKNLQLPIEDIDDNIERKIWDLFTKYSEILHLDQQYNQEMILGGEDEKDVEFQRAIIEYIDDINENNDLKTYTYTTKRRFIRKNIKDPVLEIELPNIIEKNIDNGWFINDEV